ncbi:MAG TPA: hypothetical protein VN026_10735 [Bacteroidia bacterium]|jgi:hypothetical protein|nr:hypothetical protein [Bacteroidia bacterium]
MNYEAGIELAHQRMREIGKKSEEYHIEVVTVVGTSAERAAGRIQVKAYNQYYYLINFENYYGLEILSDTGYFNSFDFTNNTILEFTGSIIIQKLSPAAIWSISADDGSNQNHPVVFIKATIF